MMRVRSTSRSAAAALKEITAKITAAVMSINQMTKKKEENITFIALRIHLYLI